LSTSLLAVDCLTVNYGEVCALDAVTLEISAGSFVGLIGANGAGKTTFIEAVTGLTSSEGCIVFSGQEVGGVSPSRRARLGLGRTFQSLELFEDMSVRDNVLVSAETSRWFSPIVELVWPVRQAAAERAVDDALELLELTPFASSLPSTLSLGQRKLVTVARALSGRPKLLLLDEPAAGLDSDESLALGEKLRWVADNGTTVLLVDHDVGLVLRVCDWIHVLEFGKVIASGTPEEIAKNDLVIRSYLGEATDKVVGTSETAS
jgi:ABC-type branched-subunit amino acid transport system ATPase component